MVMRGRVIILSVIGTKGSRFAVFGMARNVLHNRASGAFSGRLILYLCLFPLDVDFHAIVPITSPSS